MSNPRLARVSWRRLAVVSPPTPGHVAALVRVLEAALRPPAGRVDGRSLRLAVAALVWLVSVYGRPGVPSGGVFLSTEQVAELTGVTVRTVRRRAASGVWPGASLVGGRWVVPASAVGAPEVSASFTPTDAAARALAAALDAGPSGTPADRGLVRARFSFLRGWAFEVGRAERVEMKRRVS